MTTCEFNATIPGAGDFIVASATVGHFTPENSNVIDGKVYTYYATCYDLQVPPNITGWEAGSGAYIVSTHKLQRTTITANSDGTLVPVNFSLAPVVGVYAAASRGLEPLGAPVSGNTGPNPTVQNTTQYISPAGINSLEFYVVLRMPCDGIISNLNVETGGSPGVAQQWAFTMRKNNTNMPVTCTIITGFNQAEDNTNSFTVVKGDLVCLMIVSSATAAATNVLSSWIFRPT